MTNMRLSRQDLGLSLGLVGVVAFGGTVPATKLAVAELGPWLVTLGRAALAGLLAAAVLAVTRRPLPQRSHWLDLSAAAICLVIGFPGFIALAMQTQSASHGGVVLAILPLATAIVGAAMLREQVPRSFWGWSLLGTGAVVLFALSRSGMALSVGDVWLLAAVVCTAFGYVFSARVSKGMPGWETISWQLVLMLPLTVPAALLLATKGPATVTAGAWLGFTYVTLISQYLGFFAWNAGLAMGGVARVSQVQMLQTFVTLAIAALVLGEHVPANTYAFALAVAGAVLMARRALARQT